MTYPLSTGDRIGAVISATMVIASYASAKGCATDRKDNGVTCRNVATTAVAARIAAGASGGLAMAFWATDLTAIKGVADSVQGNPVVSDRRWHRRAPDPSRRAFGHDPVGRADPDRMLIWNMCTAGRGAKVTECRAAR
ncbi:MAG: hypothetical protein AAFP87_12195 [Pseudomonadota bacterium]